MTKTTQDASDKKATARKTSAKKRGGKAKKASVKRNISTDLIPIEKETWLLQPLAVTMMRHDYSLIQVRILVSVVENLQAIIRDFMNSKQPERQLSMFKTEELDEDGRMPIKLPFKELGVDPNHYPQLRTSLKMLASIPIEIPYKTAEGRKYTKATNLCDVYIPKDKTYNKYAVLKVDRGVAERLVSLELGYHRLGKQIVFACKNRYTQRIYMFLGSWAKKGRTVIKTVEFRKMLRLENNYKKFSDFCRRVLEPAKAELKELAEKGFCDCYFDYEKKFDNGQRGGEPDELIFHVYRANNSIDENLKKAAEMQQDQFRQMLIRYFSFKDADATKMSKRINAENYQAAMAKLMNLKDVIRKSNVKDKAAYTYASLDNFFHEEDIPNTVVEEVE